jgi:hypothetical protein
LFSFSRGPAAAARKLHKTSARRPSDFRHINHPRNQTAHPPPPAEKKKERERAATRPVPEARCALTTRRERDLPFVSNETYFSLSLVFFEKERLIDCVKTP